MRGHTIETSRLSEAYPNLIEQFKRAPEVSSRYGSIKEYLDFTLVLREPLYSVVDRPGLSLAFMYAELDQFLAGEHNGTVLRAVSPQAAGMITQETSYAGRVGRQMPHVAAELDRALDSRRAVAYVGKPDDLMLLQNVDHERDVIRNNEIACSCVWQFIVRENRDGEPALHMICYSRSWDVVWGLCYDVTSGVACQAALAKHLSLPLGDYVHHAGSAHLYERHWDMDAQSREGDDGKLNLDLLLGDTYGQTMLMASNRIQSALDRAVKSKDYGQIKTMYRELHHG